MNPMTPTEDIRAARHRLARQFGNNLDRIVADLRRKQQETGREYITLERRSPVPIGSTNKSLQRSGG